MTKQACFRLTLATFAVTLFVNSSGASEAAKNEASRSIESAFGAALGESANTGGSTTAWTRGRASPSIAGGDEQMIEKPLDISDRAIRRAIRDAKFQYDAPGVTIHGPMRRSQRNARVARMRIFTVDTRDQTECAAFRQMLDQMKPARIEDNSKQICDENSAERMRSVLVIDDVDSGEFRRQLDANLITATDKNLVTDTRTLAVGNSQATGLLWSPTENLTKWENRKSMSDSVNLFEPFKDPARKTTGRDLDQKTAVNSGYPIAGAATYTFARRSGKSELQSFGYSVAMSTYFLEYGVDAFSDAPSVKELILGPIVTAVVGEYFFRLGNQIKESRGEVLGSKAVGKIAMVVLNPAGSFADAVNQAAGAKVIQNSRADLVLRRYTTELGTQANLLGLQLSFTFGHAY